MIWPLTTSLLLTSLLLANSAPAWGLVVTATHHADSSHWMSSVCLILFLEWPIPLLPWALFFHFKKKQNKTTPLKTLLEKISNLQFFTYLEYQSSLRVEMISEDMQSLNKFPFHFFFRKLLEDVLHQHDIITQERGNGIQHWREALGIPRMMVMGSSAH